MPDDPPAVVLCPSCRLIAPAGSTRCRRCLGDLRGQPERTAAAVHALLEEAGWPAGTGSGSLRARIGRSPVRAAAVLVVLVSLSAWFGYARCVRAPGPLPLPAARTAAVAPEPGAWPVAGGNLGATRALHATATLDAPATWTRQFAVAVAQPLVADADALYVALADGRLMALSADRGDVRWSLALGDAATSAPTIAGDRVFLALPRGRLVAVDRAAGSIVWDVAIGSAVATAPLVADGVVYAFGAPHITGLDAESGAILWRVGVGDSVALSHAAIDGDWMAAVTTDRLLVFDRRTGERSYWYQVPPVVEGLALADGVIVVAASRTLVAIDATSRRPWWEPVRAIWFQFWVWGSAPRTPPPPSLWVTRRTQGSHEPAVSDQAVVLASAEGRIAAYDRRSGALRWERATDPVIGPPIITASGVVTAHTHMLRLVDPTDGSDLRVRPLDDELSAVLVTGHGIYLTLRSGAVQALR